MKLSHYYKLSLFAPYWASSIFFASIILWSEYQIVFPEYLRQFFVFNTIGLPFYLPFHLMALKKINAADGAKQVFKHIMIIPIKITLFMLSIAAIVILIQLPRIISYEVLYLSLYMIVPPVVLGVFYCVVIYCFGRLLVRTGYIQE